MRLDSFVYCFRATTLWETFKNSHIINIFILNDIQVHLPQKRGKQHNRLASVNNIIGLPLTFVYIQIANSSGNISG